MDKTGKPAYKVKARYLEHYPDDDSMKLQQSFFSFYENNIKSWTAQANEALILQKSEIIHLRGKVVLKQLLSSNKNTPTMLLTAEQLTLEPKRNLIHTKSKIKLIQGNRSIQAIGMRADMNKNRIEFLSQTRSYYVLPAK